MNDAHGHGVGDEVLRTLADLLGKGLRRIDVVGRCGGEEFGVMLLDTNIDDGGAGRQHAEAALRGDRLSG